MPIASCYLTSSPADADADEIVARWSARSRVDPGEMTVNLISTEQGGKRYAAMAWLYLPSLWADEAVVALSEGLAGALADVLGANPESVMVVTSIVAPGFVVEGGSAVRW